LFALEILIAVISKTAPFTSKFKVLLYAGLFFCIWLVTVNNAALIALKIGIPANFWFINTGSS